MVTRNIVTRRFEKEMAEVFKTDVRVCNTFRMEENTRDERDFFVKLAKVMMQAMLNSNSVLKNSERLTAVIAKIVFRDAEEKIAAEIQEYFVGADMLDIDGYICFMLREYSEKIDEVLYSAVKSGLTKG